MMFSRQNLSSEHIRKDTIALSCKTGAGHLAPSLSTVEILTVLFRDFLQYNQENAKDETRDRFILSKGHGAYAYYIILNKLGFLPNKELDLFYTDQSTLTGCLSMNTNYMIEASTGSLGHGLPIAVGMAMSFKKQQKPNRVVCMVGDGEMQEGSNYEALQFATRYNLDNLMVIVDANGLQAMDRTEDVALDNERLARILNVYTDNNFYDINGHDEQQLFSAMQGFFSSKSPSNTPYALFCRTTKGKGIDFMENVARFHFRCPTEDGYICCTEVPE